MRLPFKVLAALAVLAACALAGCASIDQLGGGDGGTASTVFSDLPVPDGFTLNESLSYYQLTNASRSGHLVYAGHEATSDLVIFYQQQLPANNWTMVSVNVAGYAGTLVYAKANQTLTIAVQSDPEKNARLTFDLA